MLSRRNIRVKVMQLLYAQSRDKGLEYPELLQRYRQAINKSYELYLFNLLQLTKISQYALKDAARRTAKLLPSDEDKQFTAKIFENDLTQAIVENPAFIRSIKKHQMQGRLDEDNHRSFYAEISKTDYYRDYIKKSETTYKDHMEVLLAMYKTVVANELYNDLMEDHYSSWVDDKSLIVGTIKKTLKALPGESNFCKLYLPSDETTKEFGETLLNTVVNNNEELLALIEPTLKNWDVDRVAVIDMILLKMALCELMSFSSIPTKVTLNEFVEISKQYSTEKSKDFINGILDRLMKKLEKQGKIKKEGRGLVG